MSTTFTLLFHYCTLTFNHFIANLLSYPVHHPAFIVSHMYLHSPPPLPSDPHPSSLLFSLCIPDPSVLTLYSLAVISLSPPSLSWHAASDSGRGGGSVSWWQQRKQGKVPADCGSDDGVSLVVVVLFPNPPQVLSRCFFFLHAYSALVQFCFIFTNFSQSHQEAAVLQVQVFAYWTGPKWD